MLRRVFAIDKAVRCVTSGSLSAVWKTGVAGLLALVLFSCAGSGGKRLAIAPDPALPETAPVTVDKSRKDVRSQRTARLNGVPASVDATLLPPIGPRSGAGGGRNGSTTFAVGPLIDVVVDNTPAKAFFMGLAEGSELNVIVHPQVRGDITLKLFHATIPQAIETACRMYDFDCQRTELGYFIHPARLQSRQYHVNYLRLNREGVTRTRVSSGKTTVSASSSSDSGGEETSTQNFETSGSSLVTNQRFHFWGEFTYSLCGILGMGFSGSGGAATGSKAPPAAPPLTGLAAMDAAASSTAAAPAGPSGEGLLSWNPASKSAVLGCAQRDDSGKTIHGRRVVITPQTGNVLVRAYPSELREVERFLKRQKSTLERQVILEAKILEVELNEGFQSGVNWRVVLPHRDRSTSHMATTGGGSLLGDPTVNPIFSESATAGFSPSDLTDPLARTMFGGAFATALDLSDFTALIELLKTQGEVRVLSSPRVATLNNQKAVIRVGSDELFVTDVEAESSSSSSGNNSVTLIPKFTTFFSGIALDVTPQIGNDLEVMLHIHPTVSEVTTDHKQIVLGSQTQTYPLALNRVREADSMVRAGNGEIVIIGGLMKDVSVTREAGTPVLKDLPLLGKMFSHEQKVSKKTELVILMRPRVIPGGRGIFSSRRAKKIWYDSPGTATGHPEITGNRMPVRAVTGSGW